MAQHEAAGKSNEWYTPKHIFDALECSFDLDVAAPEDRRFCHVPAANFITADSLAIDWFGFVWMNAPFGDQNDKYRWLQKFVGHSNGIALTPDRTSAPWWQYASKSTECVLFIDQKPKFIRQDGSIGDHPGNGVSLFGMGEKAMEALSIAEDNGLGQFYSRRQRVFIAGISLDAKKTWRVVVGEAMEELGKEATLQDMYEAVMKMAPSKVKNNDNFKAKIRQQLQMHCKRIARATYSLN